MSLGRIDLLIKQKPIASFPIRGYIAHTRNPNVLRVVIFFEGMKFKGYLVRKQLELFLWESDEYVKIGGFPKYAT